METLHYLLGAFLEYVVDLFNSRAGACSLVATGFVIFRASYAKSSEDTLLHVIREIFFLSILIFGLHPIGAEYGLGDKALVAISALLGMIGTQRLAQFLLLRLTVQLWDFFLSSWDIVFVQLTNKIANYISKLIGVDLTDEVLANRMRELNKDEIQTLKAKAEKTNQTLLEKGFKPEMNKNHNIKKE